MPTRYIYDLGDKRVPSQIGSKADNLRYLMRKGFATPKSYVCTWDAYLRYLSKDPDLLDELSAQLSARLDLSQQYAVRSSANLEDGSDRSFAGQFTSVLDVEGVEALMLAVERVWAATHSQSIETYLEQSGRRSDQLKMAVLIQEMVQPVVSGVAFSKNPTNGADEIVIEAVRGSGKTLLQDGITPGRWVSRSGTWTVRPEREDISIQVIGQVLAGTMAIARSYRRPVDLEWVFDGTSVYWVQLREITALDDLTIYSNSASKEVLPGIIKPLVWSVNVPLVNGAWIDLFSELTGRNDIDPMTLAKSFYRRAYFNVTKLGDIYEELGLPRSVAMRRRGTGTGEGGLGFRPSRRSLRHLPRIARFVIDKWRFDRKVDAFLPAMRARYESFAREQVDQLSPEQLLEQIDQLHELTKQTAYYNIVIPLLMQVHTARLRRALHKVGIDLESFDARGGVEELGRHDLAPHLGELNRMYRQMDSAQQDRIRGATYEELLAMPELSSFQKAVERFLDQFGHLSDSSNDFSSTPWRENPDLVLQMIVEYAEPKRTSALRFEDLQLPPSHRAKLCRLHSKARQFMIYREAVGSLYAFGYGLFRSHFLALGDYFVRQGLVESRFDVFYLHLDEIRGAVCNLETGAGFREAIAERKQEMAAYRDIVLPEVIYGEEQPPVKRSREPAQVLRGIATSRGYYRGPAKVVQGVADLARVVEGDVLVIPYSDVGWTPLFARAKAVIAESGGMLSHSSVIAREYGIPAVVSVPEACHLPDGTVVTVDGYRGVVEVGT